MFEKYDIDTLCIGLVDVYDWKDKKGHYLTIIHEENGLLYNFIDDIPISYEKIMKDEFGGYALNKTFGLIPLSNYVKKSKITRTGAFEILRKYKKKHARSK